MAIRVASKEIEVRFDEATYRALKEHAAQRREPVAVVVRRFVARGLVAVSSDVQAQALADAVRGVIHDELRPTRHYAYLAAREAAASHRYNTTVLRVILQQLLKAPTDLIDRTLGNADGAAMRYATQHLDEDKEPDALALDALAKPLPGPEDEVTVEDEDTASMIEGA